MSKPKVIAIVGPTASGKTSLGVYLARKLGGEVVSADSRQVYRGLNLGTGKATKKEMSGVPHHLLDVASPKKDFSAHMFVEHATRAITTITTNNRVPLVVGGTGFYTDTLLGRITLPTVPPNPTLRKELDKKDIYTLFAILKKLDPARAKHIEPHHKRRLIRAIEIARAVGKSPAPTKTEPYEVLWLGIAPSKETLHTNIHTRLKARLRAGMVAEAKRLHAQGLSYTRMEALGLEYRYLAWYLQKKIDRTAFETELERAIQKYAKRQLRWLKRNKEIIWVTSKTEALRLSKKFLD